MKIHKKRGPDRADEQFFADFYEQYKRFIYCMATRYAHTAPEQEDLVQDAIVRLLRNIPTLRDLNSRKAATYVALTVKTAFLDRERKKTGVTEVPLDDDLFVPPDSRDRDTAMSAYLEVEKLRASLSPRDWLMLEGKYILGYSQEELAELLDIAPDSVRMLLSRAREHARKLLLRETGERGGSDDR